jgi:hypothetical protein
MLEHVGPDIVVAQALVVAGGLSSGRSSAVGLVSQIVAGVDWRGVSLKLSAQGADVSA